jgi:serine/threonine protein kinase
VQKLIDGHPLDEYLKSNLSFSGPIEFRGLASEEFYQLSRRLADAVRRVHSRLVIHGDIWPQNIMVRNNGDPILIDFGQASFRDAVQSIVKVSGRNEIYIAPEKKRSVQGDVYSLGGVLFYLATGQDPPDMTKNVGVDLNALTALILEKIRNMNHQLYQDTRGVADIIANCLCSSDDRYPNARTVVEHLDTFFRKTSHVSLPVADAISDELGGEQLVDPNQEIFRRMGGLLVHVLRDDLADMAKGSYDLVSGPRVIAAAMTQYLSLLDNNDQYLTISNPRFWAPPNPGSNGEYLSMNLMAARRSAKIKHLLIITPDDEKYEQYSRIMEAQIRALREVRNLVPEASYEVKLLFVSNHRGEEVLNNGHHFRLLVKQDELVAVYPDYRRDGSIAAVRFLADRHLVGNLRGTFESYWWDREAMTLKRWPTLEEIRIQAVKKFDARGEKHGFDLEDWTQARRELIEKDDSAPGPGGENH